MILEALYRLAEHEELMGDPDYEIKPVAWLVHVDEGGRLLRIVGTHQVMEAVGKRTPVLKPKAFPIPRQPTGRSGTKAPPAFFVDNAKYVFGIPTKDKAFSREEGIEKAGWFRDAVAGCAEDTGDEGAVAILSFLDRVHSGEQKIILPEECKSNELFAFVYAPDLDRLVHQRPSIREYWKRLRANPVSGSRRFRCLLSGRPLAEPPLIPLLKNVPGKGTAGGIALISFNENAFESYGWRGNANAPISRYAAEAVSTALNRLLHPGFPDPRSDHAGEILPRRNFILNADTVVCYWASDRVADVFLDMFDALLNPDDPSRVGELYRSLWRGRQVGVENPSRFYALTITGVKGRAILRNWLESSVAEVVKNLARHFADLDIVRLTPPPKGRELPPQIPLRVLLASLAPNGKSDGIPAPLAVDFVNAALRGAARYPLAILQKAIERARAEIGRSEWADLERRDARAALIKAVLRRTYSHEELTPAMDPTNIESGYLLGRLMAILERLQQLALGVDVNATVVDRFFGAASATPQAVFPRLLKNARHHARKAADDPKFGGTSRWLDREIDEIIALLGIAKHRQGLPYTGFPAHLSLEQQGLFVLGYHQQRHWLRLGREERERITAERGGPVPAGSGAS